MTTAVFPGSFDPPTYGHLNIVERASRLFDRVDVVVAVNPEKRSLFTADERIALMRELTGRFANVSVHRWEGLIVNYARQSGANILLRGIRGASDFSYEFDLSLLNHSLNGSIETLLIPTEQRYSIVKSSAIKELAMFGGDISGMVPPLVAAAMGQKYGRGEP